MIRTAASSASSRSRFFGAVMSFPIWNLPAVKVYNESIRRWLEVKVYGVCSVVWFLHARACAHRCCLG